MSRVGNVWKIDGIASRSTMNMKEETWLGLRRQGIGGSDIGAIMGLNPYRSRFHVWCDKKGLIPAEPMNEDMEFGVYMEPVLRKWAQERLQAMGHNLVALSSPYIYFAADDERALANIDGVLLPPMADDGNPAAPVLLECKTASIMQASKWEGDEIPDSYYAQVQWYMRVTGLASCWMAALVGKRFLVRQVPRNDTFIEQAKFAAEDFYVELDTNTMPAPAGLDSDFGVLLQLYPEGNDKVLDKPEMEDLLRGYVNHGTEIADLEERRDLLKANIEAAIGDAKVLVAGQYRASWSRFDRTSVNTELLKSNFPEAYEATKKTTLSGRLTVAMAKPKKETK